jgi:hypothetical protein
VICKLMEEEEEEEEPSHGGDRKIFEVITST